MDSRRRRLKKKKLVHALKRARARCCASAYINHLSSEKRGQIYVRCPRGSTRAQKPHLQDQFTKLEIEVLKRGGVVATPPHLPIGHIGHGSNPKWLTPYAKFAKKHGYCLLAESTDRFIRSPDYHPHKNPHAQPTERDYRRLRQATLGIKLVTLLHPDASYRQVRRYQTRRGQIAKCQSGGRPQKQPAGYKKQRRQELQPQVVELRHAGLTERAIGQKLGVAPSVVHSWLHREKRP